MAKSSSRTKILDTAKHILHEEGLLAVTTNRLAEKSGVNISVLYRHFRNKVDVYKELLSEMEAQRVEFLSEHPLDLTCPENFYVWVDDGVDGLHQFRKDNPALRELRLAVPLYSELNALDTASARKAAEVIVASLVPSPPRDSVPQLTELFIILSELVSQVLDTPDPKTNEVTPERINHLKDIFHACFPVILKHYDLSVDLA